jgi:hypothetical protein
MQISGMAEKPLNDARAREANRIRQTASHESRVAYARNFRF